MPVTINGSVLTQNDPTGVTPSTLTFTSTVLTAGDIVVLIVNQNSPNNPPTAGTPTGGTGLSWSTAADQANTATHNSRTTAFWTKVPSDQTSTITVDTTAGGNNVGTDGILYRLSGVDQVTPIGATDGFQGQTDPTSTDLQLTGTKAGSMIIMAASDWSAGTAALTISISNTTSGTTDRSNLETAEYRSIAHHANQSGSTNQGTLDYSAATGDWAAIIFEVDAASAVAAAYTPPDTFLPDASLFDIADDTGDPTLGFLYRTPDYTSIPVTADVTVNADNAAFTLLAQDAVAAIGVNADSVALTIAGQDAVAGIGANADVAAISLLAQDATAAVAVNAECATWTLIGNNATAGLGANAENALWTLAGQDAVAALGVNAGAVTIVLAAQDAVAAIGANVDFAPINLLANDTTVQVSGSTNALAECATWSLAAQDATAGIGANADITLVSLLAQAATVSVGANADLVPLAFTALDITTQPPIIAYVEVIGTSLSGTIGAGSNSGAVEGSSTAGTVGAGSTSGAVEGGTVIGGLPA